MIYFEFAICRDPERSDSVFEPATAEFMFNSADPGESTRRAALLLRSRGWRAMSVEKALEGFTREEFDSNQRLTALWDRAESGGVGYCLNTPELAELAPEELV